MSKITGRLTVFFDDPYWIGIFERIENGKLQAAKVTFGAEPEDCDIYEFILKAYSSLKFSPPVHAEIKEAKKNPKRIQREVRRQLTQSGTGTKSQYALKMQHEQLKTERRQIRRAHREDEKQRIFELKKQKRKNKHRGH